MKTVQLVLVMLLALFAGCLESVTPDQVNTLTGNVNEVMLAIDEVQEALSKSEVLDKERVDAFNKETDKVQEQVAAIATAIEENKDKSILEVTKAAADDARPFNPYAAETEIALLVATGVAGWFAKKNNDKAKKSDAKYQAHKAATELVKLKHPGEIATEIYAEIGKARAQNGIG